MDTVPLELQRKCEQRWAARYRRPLEPSATLEHRLDGNACADSSCHSITASSRPLETPSSSGSAVC
jgi:hypothetical protein